jgi:signal transduction histidine kinase
MTSVAVSSIQIESSRRHSLTRSLFLWITLSVVALATALALVSVALARRQVTRDLQNEARQFSKRAACLLVSDIWNLDVPALNAYLSSAPLQRDITYVCIRNEFSEPIAHIGVVNGTPISASEPVYSGGELIGFVDVGVSTREVDALQRTVIGYAAAMGGLGSLGLGLLVWLATGVLLKRPLHQLTIGLKRIADGDYESQVPPSRYMEIDEINGEVNTMAQTIALRTRQLETEVRERRRAETELRTIAGNLENLVEERTQAIAQTNRRLSEEIAQRMQAQDQILAISSYEQRRIGHDLHDSLGQELAGAAFLGGALTHALRKHAPEMAPQAEQLTGVLSRAVSEIRRIAHGLTPVEPATGGLMNSLRGLCSDAAHSFGIECTFQSEIESCDLDPTVGTHLYRIAQEAIHNAIRHGHAARVVVSLRENRSSGLSALSIVDNGTGIPNAAADSPGLGLRTIRYRAEAINGRVDVTAMDGGGTMVLVEFRSGSAGDPHEAVSGPPPPVRS